MTPVEMTEFLHRHIPVAAAMNAEAVLLKRDHALLRGQLGPNINPYGVVFGGSLATFGLLASWTLVHRALIEACVAAYPVVRRTGCEFLRPVSGEFFAEARADTAALHAFAREAASGRAEMEMRSVILANGREAAIHTALFVALNKATEKTGSK